MAKKKGKISSALCKASPWKDRENEIWLASTLKFYRNLNKFRFPGKLDGERRKQILSLVDRAVSGSMDMNEVSLFPAEEMDPLQKEFLIERFLGTESLQRAHTGEGFVLSEPNSFLALVNIRDHLQLQLTDYDGNLEDSLNRLIDIEGKFRGSFEFAFNPQFGFLSANPEHSGTGLVVQAYLQVPALLHSDQLSDALAKCRREGVVGSSLRGASDSFLGSVVVLRNNYCLGVTEEAIVAAVRSCATKVMVEEQARRNQLRQENGEAFRDKVSRAYGLLTHIYQIETVEALDALALLKLGIGLGWITGVTTSQLNEIFFNCRRAPPHGMLHETGKGAFH